MDFTIAICTWNRADLLDKTLMQMHSMRIPPSWEWELLVINNNCTDHTSQVVERHAARLPVRSVIEVSPGLSHARNRAIAESRGQYILWTDDDVLVDPSWVTETLASMNQFQANVAFGKVTPWWETSEPAWFGPKLAGRFALIDLGDENFIPSRGCQVGYGANHAVRRSVYDQLGGYRTDLGVTQDAGGGGEDTEFFKRCADHGLRIVYSGRARVQHFIPAQRCQKKYFRARRWKGGRDQLRLLRSVPHAVPTIWGMPRYLLSQGASDAICYARSVLRRKHEEAFHRELRLIGLASLLRHAAFPHRQQNDENP